MENETKKKAISHKLAEVIGEQLSQFIEHEDADLVDCADAIALAQARPPQDFGSWVVADGDLAFVRDGRVRCGLHKKGYLTRIGENILYDKFAVMEKWRGMEIDQIVEPRSGRHLGAPLFVNGHRYETPWRV